MAKVSDFRRFVELGKKIVACGRNYKYVSTPLHFLKYIEHKKSVTLRLFHILLEFIRAHATELGNTVLPEPMLFLKPTTSYLKEGGKIIVRTV